MCGFISSLVLMSAGCCQLFFPGNNNGITNSFTITKDWHATCIHVTNEHLCKAIQLIEADPALAHS